MDRSAASLLTLALLLGAVLVMAHLFPGCAWGPKVQCPYGTFPRHAASSASTTGSASGEVSIPAKGGKAGATWGGSGSADWECARICPTGTAIQLSEAGDGRRQLKCVELHDCPAAKDGGPR